MADSPPASSSSRRRTDRHPDPFFAFCPDDLLHNILRRLPAHSFAFASSVCKTWHRVSKQILSRPRMASAVSLNRSPVNGLTEVFDKVLSEPIRPDFAIINVGVNCDLPRMLRIASSHLNNAVPIIGTCSGGVIGRDATTGEVIEAQGGDGGGKARGVALTVGFVPGLKVHAIPLKQHCVEPTMVDEFVMDIREFSASVSGQPHPVGIMMFGDGRYDLKHAIEKLDYAMSMETAIVGDERVRFVYQTADKAKGFFSSGGVDSHINAVALTFARDRDNTHGFGEIKFHVALSEGVSAVGPIYKAVSVKQTDHATWLTGKIEGTQVVLDGESMMRDIDEEPGNISGHLDLYIGVTKRRKYAIGSEKASTMTSLSLHNVFRADEEYLYVEGLGIRTGDRFQFYTPNDVVALSTCEQVRASLGRLNLGIPATDCHRAVATSVANSGANKKEEVFGGFIFSCCGRGEYFFGASKADSSPFTKNFPGVPFAGVFCGGEIGRRTASLIEQDSGGGRPVSPCSSVYSSVYLVTTYTAPPPVQEAGQ